ncbi:hypothetical protein ACWDBP_02870 [Streptomyces sp. NPDC001233]
MAREAGDGDVAFVWLPLPDAERSAWTMVAEKPRLGALVETHLLTAREENDFTDLVDDS